MAILSAAVSEPIQPEALPVSETLSSAPPDTMQLPALCEETLDMQSTVEQLRKEKEDLEGQLKNEHFSNAVLLAALEKQKADVLAQGARFVAVDTPGSVQELDEQHREEVQVLMQRAEQEIQESVESVKREMQESSARAVAKAVEECKAAKDAEMSRLEERHRLDLFHQKMTFKRAMLRIVPEMARNLNRWHFGLVSAINDMLPADSPSEGPSLGGNPFGNKSPSRGGAAALGDPAPPQEAVLPQPDGQAAPIRALEGRSVDDRETHDTAGASPLQSAGRADDLDRNTNEGADRGKRGEERRDKRKKGGDAEASEPAASTGTGQAVLRTKKKRLPPLEDEESPAKRPRSASLSSRQKKTQTANAQAPTGKRATPSLEKLARTKIPKAPKVKGIGSKTRKSPKRTAKVPAERSVQSEPLDSAEEGPSDGREEPGLRATWGTELLMSPGFVPEYDSERWESQFPWGSQMGLEGGEQTGADAGRGEEAEATRVAWGNQIGLEGGVEMGAEDGAAHGAEGAGMGEEPEPDATQERQGLDGNDWDTRRKFGAGTEAGAPEDEVTRGEEAPNPWNEGLQGREATETEGERERKTEGEGRRPFLAGEGTQDERAQEEVPGHEESDRSPREAKSIRARSHYQRLKSLESIGTDGSAREGSPRQEGLGQADERTPPIRLHLKRLRKVSARDEIPGHTLPSEDRETARIGQLQLKEKAREKERAAHKTARGNRTPPAESAQGSEPSPEGIAQESEPPAQDMGVQEEPSARIPARGHEPPSLQPFDEAHRRRVKCRGRGPGGKETYGTLAFEEAGGRIELCWVWCECADCMRGGGSARQPLTPAKFERHAGSARKNWRTSVVCCTSGRTLRDELGEVPLQRGQKRP